MVFYCMYEDLRVSDVLTSGFDAIKMLLTLMAFYCALTNFIKHLT